MRLAVCVSGQLRGDDAALRVLASTLHGLDATIIFSVWDRYGGKIDGSLNLDQMPRLFDGAACSALPFGWIGEGRLWAALPTLRQQRETMFEGDGQADAIRQRLLVLFPQAVIDIEQADTLALAFDQAKEDRNSLRMLYKLWRANEIKRRLERQQGARFDAVIRLRPDLLLPQIDLPRLADAISRKVILVSGFIPGGGFVGDNFAAGSSAAMDRYASLFGRAVVDPEGWDFIHRELHRHLQSQGLAYELHPNAQQLAADRCLSAADLDDHLAEMEQASDAAWTPLHAVTRRALQGAHSLSLSQAAQAQDRLLEGGMPCDAGPQDLDGWLAVMGRAQLQLGRPAAAVACLLSAWSRRNISVAALRGAALEELCDALSQVALGLDGRGAPAELGRELLAAVETAELMPWLEQAWNGQVLDMALGQAWLAVWRHGTLCRPVIARLQSRGELKLLLQRQELFRFEGVGGDLAVTRLHAQLRAAVREQAGAEALMRHWATLDPSDDTPRRWLAAHGTGATTTASA